MGLTLYRYELFSLRLASEIELPELFAATVSGEAELCIRQGPVERLLALDGGEPGEVEFRDADGGVIVQVRDVARFHVRDGCEIMVDSEPMADARNVRLFLLGTASGILVQQRGLLPLHANAVELGGKAVAFSGESGAGKSTLAAWFHDRGANILCDDVCVIGFGPDTRPMALPGLPRFRLWRDAVKRSGRLASDHPRSFVGDDSYDKYDVAVSPSRSQRDPLPLGAIGIIERGDAFRCQRLAGVEAVNALFEHTYRGTHLGLTGGHHYHWEMIVRLAAEVPIYRVTRQWGGDVMDAQNLALIEAMGLPTTQR